MENISPSPQLLLAPKLIRRRVLLLVVSLVIKCFTLHLSLYIKSELQCPIGFFADAFPPNVKPSTDSTTFQLKSVDCVRETK